MQTLNTVVLKHLDHALLSLVWKCEGCPQCATCSDDTGEPRYCIPMIRAAIMGDTWWDTDHDQGDLRNQNLYNKSLHQGT